jgi:hypothetical protein
MDHDVLAMVKIVRRHGTEIVTAHFFCAVTELRA